MEFGHRAFPIYTTLRDLLLSLGASLAVGAIVYLTYSPFLGLGVAFVLMAIGLFVSQQLRKVWGNAWPWELYLRTIWRMFGNPDMKGYLGGKRRVHAVTVTDAKQVFRSGNIDPIAEVIHHGCVVGPYARYRPGTASVARVARTSELRREGREDNA